MVGAGPAPYTKLSGGDEGSSPWSKIRRACATLRSALVRAGVQVAHLGEQVAADVVT